jgi:hypothetical protein
MTDLMERDFSYYQLEAFERELGLVVETPNTEIGFIFEKENIEQELKVIRNRLAIAENGLSNSKLALIWFQNSSELVLDTFAMEVNSIIKALDYDPNWFMAFGFYLLTGENNIPSRMVPPRQEYMLKTK